MCMDLDGCRVWAAVVTKSQCVGVSGCLCLGHVNWRWCLCDKNTDMQSKTHTLPQRKSHVSKADRRSDKSAVAGTCVSHANPVLKFVLVPVGVVCFLSGCV